MISIQPVFRLSCLFVALSVGHALGAEQALRFNRDIRPILSDKCFACHGPAASDGDTDLRLDSRESAVEDWGAIVPGSPEESELVRRIDSTDADEVMPPTDAHNPLDDEQRALLRRWVKEGANYEPHWAYKPLVRPAVPGNSKPKSVAEAIDSFIEAQMRADGIEPVSEADRITLIRRLSFDLTGMPPTAAEVDSFVHDRSPDAYEKLVDRLLESPRFGERMAIYWLDLVRYADTVGYHGDQNVSQTPYRDYVINSFNANTPYSQFIREQLAGDLLPNASLDQQVASGYNRLNQTTEEGGAQPKEYLAIYFADRVRNVSQVFMGATMGCAQCHDHKYDPYTLRDFYSLGAFFADLKEQGKYEARSRPPQIPVPTEAELEQLAEIDREIAVFESRRAPLEEQALPGQSAWETIARARLREARETATVWVDDQELIGAKLEGEWHYITDDEGPVHSQRLSRVQRSAGQMQHFFDDATSRAVVSRGTRFFAWVYLDPEDPPAAIMLQFNDGSWNHRAVWGSDAISYGRRSENWAGYQRLGDLPEKGQWVRLQVDAERVGLEPGDSVKGMAFTQFGGQVYWDQAGWSDIFTLPAHVEQALSLDPSERTTEQANRLRKHYLSQTAPIKELDNNIARLQAQRNDIEHSATTTVVSEAVSPRTIRILPRGNWMDDSGEIVEPAIPEFLGELQTGPRRANRLDFANWLCEPDNVLTSRTMANRLWYLMFGRGICSSVDDLGGQGTYPSHPDLLDWLAVEFVQSGWDVKHLLRSIVTTNAYRRSSRASEHLQLSDPGNHWLARQGRFPLPAEMVRDNALAVSGLLVEQVGGSSVEPYQPAGYYAQLNFPKRTYVADPGDDQYRRGVYVHWQRTFLHPMLKAFDAPSREECTAARARSNTPLQALTLLNDPTFVEAARVFAARIMREGGNSTDDRIVWAYRNVISREPEEPIVDRLQDLHDAHLAHYREHVEQAKELVSTGNAPVATELEISELAAWTSVARALLNLNETIVRY
ncbi:PSD1 and planctomycete cytochrome C domain-containing protein [Aeoliella straminimaris]|uniref:PSD1 and planctomycete cytochrome C domain-containing protein n=1 Tax=Aeoliella straminimaris TaxID=2954799 RepID=UPI0021BC6C50|nr:PSD1 and planctomycete cytochrome C domain-containing protein [Aeoliella straminimaris]